MWNGAGSVSPAGKACDWAGVCHCESCVAKRGEVVPRNSNELTQERAKLISDLVEAQNELAHSRVKLYQRRVELYGELVDKYRADVQWHADWTRRMWGSL